MVSSGGIQTIPGGTATGFAFTTSVGSGGTLTAKSGGSAGSSDMSSSLVSGNSVTAKLVSGGA